MIALVQMKIVNTFYLHHGTHLSILCDLLREKIIFFILFNYVCNFLVYCRDLIWEFSHSLKYRVSFSVLRLPSIIHYYNL